MNLVSIFVASVFGTLIGFLWYSPYLFGKKWFKDLGLSTPLSNDNSQMIKGTIGHFASLFLLNMALSFFVSIANTFGIVCGIALWVWVGFVFTTQTGTVFWERRKASIFLINSVHYLVVILASAAILFFF